MKKTLNSQSLLDILNGATILAAGGGGPVQTGKSLLQSMTAHDSFPQLISLDEISDSSRVGVPVAMGSCATLLENILDLQMLKALDRFRQLVGNLDAIIPVETGQVNTLAVLYTSARTGLPVLDGDGTGRSIPEFKNTVFYSANVDPNPCVMIDSVGNEVIINARSVEDLDRLGRTIDAEMGGFNGTACFPVSGAKIKQIAVPGTISQCEKLGRSLRENPTSDPINQLTRENGGFLLIKGIIEKIESRVAHGHDYGTLFVSGFGEMRNVTVKVAFKNEGLIAYKNGKPAVISPDHIFMIDLFTHMPVTFTDATEGLAVGVLALPIHPKRRTPADYEGFRSALRDVGYTGEYTPVEHLLTR
jgi:DUF917 family protein